MNGKREKVFKRDWKEREELVTKGEGKEEKNKEQVEHIKLSKAPELPLVEHLAMRVRATKAKLIIQRLAI